jgi:hypothetical protein
MTAILDFDSHEKFARIAGQLFRRGGEGATEAGCFVLGKRDGEHRRVDRVVFYDDLDPNAYRSGAISIDTTKLTPLYDLCEQERLEVVADCHTHPGVAEQSPTDARFPAWSRAGHTAVILPFDGRYRNPEQLGVYILREDGAWNNVEQNAVRGFLGLKQSAPVPNTTDRTELLLRHVGADSARRAELLRSIAVRIVCTPEASRSASGQAALITAVALSSRFARGGVMVDVPANLRLIAEPRRKLADVLLEEGASMRLADATATIVIGSADGRGGFAVGVHATEGAYGCAPASNARFTDDFVPGAVFGAALAVGEIFRRFVLGRLEVAPRRRIAALRTSSEVFDPRRVEAVWLAGFGHLGNAYAWVSWLTPGLRPRLLVQDNQRVELANASTQMFATPADVGTPKVLLARRELGRRGFAVDGLDVELAAGFKAPHDAPSTVLAGFDNVLARQALAFTKAARVLDGGLGRGADTFSTFRIEVLDSAEAPDRFIPAPDAGVEARRKSFVEGTGSREDAQTEEGRCGLYALADTAVAVPFVGVAVAAVAVTMLLRDAGERRIVGTAGDVLSSTPIGNAVH